jgi:hypothetical protein
MTQVVQEEEVQQVVVNLLGPVMHTKRAQSISLAVFGAMQADRLSSGGIGMAMAAARGKIAKHGIKQVDRLLGNDKFDVTAFFSAHVPWVVGSRKEIVVSLDWTEYATDGHSRIAINLVTNHGRATPLVWKTVESKSLKNRRNAYEDEVLLLLSRFVPEATRVIVLADRGFGDVKLYRFLAEELGMDFVIRFRGVISVETPDGETQRAKEWVPPNGRIREIIDAKLTHKRCPVDAVILVKKSGMKDAWHLATTLVGQKDVVVSLYGRRFTCEENFRDEKDDRFGLGFKETRVSTCARRDRFLVINTLATIMLTLLGAAGEELGLDRLLKSNTASRRIHSLFRQGREYIRDWFSMHADALRECLWNLVSFQPLTTEVFGLI